MTADRIEALAALLEQTEAAHGRYETTELGGVYDTDWPRWYAAYAVGHGIAQLVGRPLSSDELAAFLATIWDEHERADPKPTDAWPMYAANRIVTEL